MHVLLHNIYTMYVTLQSLHLNNAVHSRLALIHLHLPWQPFSLLHSHFNSSIHAAGNIYYSKFAKDYFFLQCVICVYVNTYYENWLKELNIISSKFIFMKIMIMEVFLGMCLLQKECGVDENQHFGDHIDLVKLKKILQIRKWLA